MADERIEDISGGELTTPASNDLMVILDVSDTTDDADGTTKNITYQNLHAYGKIYVESNSTATTISGTQTDFGANAVQVAVFDTNGESNNTTPDHTNDHITIDVTGEYVISATLSFSGEANDTYSFAFFKNNKGTQLGTRSTRKIGSGGDVGSASLSTIAALTATDTIEIWIQNEDGTTNFNCTVEDASFYVARVG